MDRIIVYPGAIPLDTDNLIPQRNAMIALGMLMRATLGTNTVVDGLTCVATTPASMTVNINPGSIVTVTTVDNTAYGSLAADTTDSIVKMGINLQATPFTLTAPTTSGQSVNYLIEAQFAESDGTPVTLPYYNAANPSQPYTGPGNAGTAQNTKRAQTVGLQIKAGVAANAGSQTTPAVDSGWVGLYIITVNYAQTTITSSSIAQHPNNPLIQTKLPGFRQRLSGNLTLYVSPTGNDANNGLSPIAPFATLQAAWNSIITNYDLNGYQVTVNVANGTYTSGVYCVGIPTGAIGGVPNVAGQPPIPIQFVGNTSSPDSCFVNVSNSNCFYVGNGANISVSGFKLAASGSSSNQGVGLYAFNAGAIVFGNVDFGACSSAHILGTVGTAIESGNSPYTISGAAPVHINAFNAAFVQITGSAITLTGSPAFSLAFVNITNNGVLFAGSNAFSGSATGVRYEAAAGGVINTQGGGASYFPGSSAGTSTTGYYS